ncbi:MAG: pyridoxamine 5'-phosphate oxidase family protein [Rikenellaceae bacterium]
MIDSKIVKFIGRHHVLTLATIDSDGSPYCSNAFYSFDEERGALVFSSNPDTAHGAHMASDQRVAASIVLETKIVGKLQGLQISGRAVEGDTRDRECYITAFPFAAVAPLSLWRLEIDFVKLTDNRLGFGKKLIWRRE